MNVNELRPGCIVNEILDYGEFSLETGRIEGYSEHTGIVRHVTRSLIRRNVKYAWIEWSYGMMSLHSFIGTRYLRDWSVRE